MDGHWESSSIEVVGLRVSHQSYSGKAERVLESC